MNDAVTLTLPQAMQHAAAAFNNGEWAKAEHLAGLILNAQADHFDALSFCGWSNFDSQITDLAAKIQRAEVIAFSFGPDTQDEIKKADGMNNIVSRSVALRRSTNLITDA